MLQAQSSALEVTRALSDCTRAARFNFGEDTAMIAVQHMLLQTVDLFKTAGDIGLNPKNIFALGKVYSNNSHVIRTLREMGVTVVDSTPPEPGEFHSYFQRDIKKLWTVAADTLLHRKIKRLLVLDDAGVCIINVPPDVLRRYAVCGVEQTSSGMFLFEETPPPCPVISWARAAVKLKIGGPIFSHSFIDKLKTEFLHGRSVRGKRFGIIGLGSIGRGVARLAIREGGEVMFYDPDSDLHIPTHLRDYVIRLDSLEELTTCSDYVVGCSGRNPFREKWPLKHKPGLRLFSASGGDQEFGAIIKDLKTRPDFKVDPDTWDITSKRGPSGSLHIAYRGYPYNFVSRALEAVPGPIVQLETGGLLAALIQARIYLDLNEERRQAKRIYRMSSVAQRFVYKRWLQAMKKRRINIAELFGYEPKLLRAAQHEHWFAEHSEPNTYDRRVEEMVSRVICGRRGASSPLRIKRETDPNLSAF